jgi:hypothetical protein
MLPNFGVSRVEGQTYVGANVQVDGGVLYVQCVFTNCNLIVTGMAPVQMDRCKIEGGRWSFAGPAANVINFLKATYQSEGREMAEAVVREIRGGDPADQIPNFGLKSGGKVQ